MFIRHLLFFVFLSTAAFFSVDGFTIKEVQADVVCGGYNKQGQRMPECGYSKAKAMGQPSSLRCPSGSFLDLKGEFLAWNDKAECWSCPQGLIRSLSHVESKDACWKPAGIGNYKASFLFKKGCPAGAFFDPRNGGECWSCPSGYRRTIYKVYGSNACGRQGSPRSKATFHGKVSKRTCKSAGGFYDPRNGGECWSCPAGTTRNITPVTSASACIKSTPHTVAPAILVKKVGCPRGSFFDIVDGGTCWQCPDHTNRSVHHVKGNKACKSKDFVWSPEVYKEPGLLNIPGAYHVLNRLLEKQPNYFREKLLEFAKARNDHSPEAFVKKKWDEMAAKLSTAPAFKAIALNALLDAAANQSDQKNRNFVKGFENYIRQRRIFMAQDSLNAYDAWHKAMVERKSKGPAHLKLVDLGTKPPDFYSQTMKAVHAVIGGGATAVTAGFFASTIAGPQIGLALNTAQFAKIAPYALKTAVKAGKVATGSLTTTGSGVGSAASAAAVPLAIVTTAAIIGTMAGQHLKAVNDARPKLEKILKKAKEPVNLQALLKEKTGLSEVTSYFLLATSRDMNDNNYFRPLAKTLKNVHKTVKAANYKNIDPSKIKSGPAVVTLDQLLLEKAAGSLKEKAVKKTLPISKMKWHEMPGEAFKLATGNDGTLWVLGNNDTIYKTDKGRWIEHGKIKAKEIAVDPSGNAWVIDASNKIMGSYKGKWKKLSGWASDLSIGAQGHLWVVGNKDQLYSWNGKNWTAVKRKAKRVAVAPDGTVWTVDAKGKISRYDGKKWINVSGYATEIAIGQNGSVWVVGSQNTLWRWKSGNNWEKASGTAVKIAVTPKGNLVALDAKNKIRLLQGSGVNAEKNYPIAK